MSINTEATISGSGVTDNGLGTIKGKRTEFINTLSGETDAAVLGLSFVSSTPYADMLSRSYALGHPTPNLPATESPEMSTTSTSSGATTSASTSSVCDIRQASNPLPPTLSSSAASEKLPTPPFAGAGDSQISCNQAASNPADAPSSSQRHSGDNAISSGSSELEGAGVESDTIHAPDPAPELEREERTGASAPESAGPTLVPHSAGTRVKTQRQFVKPVITDLSEELQNAERFLAIVVADTVLKSDPNMMPFLKASWYRMMQHIWSIVDAAIIYDAQLQSESDPESADSMGTSGATGSPEIADAPTTIPMETAPSASPNTDARPAIDGALKCLKNGSDLPFNMPPAADVGGSRSSRSRGPFVAQCTQESCREVFGITVIPFLYAFECASKVKSSKSKIKTARKNGVIKTLGVTVADNIYPNQDDTQNPFSDSVEVFMGLGASDEDNAFAAGEAPMTSMPTPPRDTMHAPKTDAYRLCLQKLFMFCLRRFIPLKYESIHELFQVYPEFRDKDLADSALLCSYANWFDLTLHTIKSQNNKSFLIAFVTQLAEGYNTKYITGSGESKKTKDRIQIFRTEGLVEKVKRAPRVRKPKVNVRKRKSHCTDGESSDSDFIEDTSVSSYNTFIGSSAGGLIAGGMPSRKRQYESTVEETRPQREQHCCQNLDVNYSKMLAGLSPQLNSHLPSYQASPTAGFQQPSVGSAGNGWQRTIDVGTGRMTSTSMNSAQWKDHPLAETDITQSGCNILLASIKPPRDDDESRLLIVDKTRKNLRSITLNSTGAGAGTGTDTSPSVRSANARSNSAIKISNTTSASTSDDHYDRNGSSNSNSSKHYKAEVFQQNSNPTLHHPFGELLGIVHGIAASGGSHPLSPMD